MPAPRRKTDKRRLTKAAVPAQTTRETATDVTSATPDLRKKNFVQPAVLDLIRSGNGQPVTLKEMAEKIGCSEGSIRNAALKLAKSVPQIDVITRGQVWRWNYKTTYLSRPDDYATGDFGPVHEPPRTLVMDSADSGEVYREVGTDSNGEAIIRKDGNLQLYRATPL